MHGNDFYLAEANSLYDVFNELYDIYDPLH